MNNARPSLSDEELSSRTAPGAKSAGARIAPLPGGGTVTYWEFGDPQGTPVLALHGLGASGLMYSAHNGFFRARALRCIAPNLVGGLADPPAGARLSDLAEVARGLMRHLGLHRFTVIGSSYGTLVGTALVARAPDAVERAGLFGPLIPGRWLDKHRGLLVGSRRNDRLLWNSAGRRQWLVRALTALYGLASTRAKIRSFIDPALPARERRMLEPGTPFHDDFGRLLEECGQRGYSFMPFALELGWGRDPGFTLEQLAASGVPLFLSTGAKDNVHLPAMARFLQEHAPGAHLEIVPDQGRMACMGPLLEERLDRFLAWCSKVASRRDGG